MWRSALFYGDNVGLYQVRAGYSENARFTEVDSVAPSMLANREAQFSMSRTQKKTAGIPAAQMVESVRGGGISRERPHSHSQMMSTSTVARDGHRLDSTLCLVMVLEPAANGHYINISIALILPFASQSGQFLITTVCKSIEFSIRSAFQWLN
jgi:hypothetical protein